MPIKEKTFYCTAEIRTALSVLLFILEDTDCFNYDKNILELEKNRIISNLKAIENLYKK